MVAKARFSTILVLLCLAVLLLQSGCNVSDDAGDPGGGQPSDAIRLTPSTPGDVRVLVADGQDSIPVRVTVTDNTGNGRAGVPVTFVTTAGTLSQAPAVPRAGQAASPEGSIAVPHQEAGEPLTVNTNANGVAEVTLTSSTRAETATVTASVPEGFRTSLQVTFFIPLAEVELRATPDQVERNSTATLTATVTDINGEPGEGEPVTFRIATNMSGATLSLDTEVTDAEGRAQVTYTAGDTLGVDTLEAVTDDGTTGTVTIAVTAEVAAVALAAGATNIVADGTSTVRLQATVTDATDAPIPGIAVTFTTTDGSLSSRTATTNDAGIATVELIAGTTLGSARVTASASGVISTEVSVTFIAGPPETVRLSANPAALSVEQPSTITAAVVDSNNNPVADVTLTFTVQPNSSGGTLSNITGTTDANGRLTVTYTAGSTAGTDVVRAVTGSVAGRVSIPVTSAGPTGEIASVTLTAGATSIVADGASSAGLRATVMDEEGTGLSGVEVTFTTTAGRLSASTATTNPQGIAIVNLVAGTNLGTARVTARAGGLISEAVSVMFIAGPPATVVLNATPTTVSAEQTAALAARVTDANNNPVAGETLTFDVSTNASQGTLSNTTGTTDADGRLTVMYTAGTRPGTDVIRVETTNDVVGTVSITVRTTPDEVAALIVTAGATSVVADGTSTVVIRAQANNAEGDGVPNIRVTFTTTAGTLAVPSTRTDPSGIARVRLTSATNLGTATVTATGGGVSNTVTVTFVAGPPATVALTTTSPTIDAGETSTIEAAVRDAHDNPVAEETLILDITPNNTGANLDVLNGQTDTDGRLVVTYTAGTRPGTDTVVARTTNDVQGTVVLTVTPTSVAASIRLLVSSSQLDSDDVERVTLTALVRDASNNVVEGADVRFTAGSGAVTVQTGTTDANGTATALLGTGGDPSQRTILVTATTGDLSSRNTVNVTGTTITISGTNTVALNATRTLSILLRDSGGRGIDNQDIMVSSARGNPLSAATVRTDAVGQATVDVRAETSGVDTITARALNVTGTFALTISPDNFIFSAPRPGDLVGLGSLATVTVHWDVDGTAQAGQTINFFATRGTLSATSAVTDDNGNARVMISSATAGPTIITAVAARTNGPASQVEITFVANEASTLILQASPASIGVNQVGEASQRSIVTAVVRDATGNIAQGQTVRFTLTDVTGGRLTAPASTTDSFGRASTVYVSSVTPSAQDGVIIDAFVGDPATCDPTESPPEGPCDRVTLTVARRPLFVTLGTGNEIAEPSTTQYAQPYSALVTDADGNPVSGATVNIRLFPTRYEKGFYTLFFDEGGTCLGWGKIRTANIDGTLANPDDADQACNSEDVDRDGILDRGEDVNRNGVLDPEQVATISENNLVTDATGFVLFDVLYAQEFTWVEIDLEARATVEGSEGSSTATFFLRGIADDFNDCEVAPPGLVSPYGVATTCGCDERAAVLGQCPTRTEVNQVIITAQDNDETTLTKERGGEVTFAVTGGTNTSYIIATTRGSLFDDNPVPSQRQPVSRVEAGQRFVLDVPPVSDIIGAITITVTAVDELTGQVGIFTVLQIDSPDVGILPVTATLPAGGGTQVFQAIGGTETLYIVSTTAGTLRNAAGDEGTVIDARAGEPFTLITTAAENGLTITITASDRGSGLEGEAEVTQRAPDPVVILPASTPIPVGGGTVTFTVSGGNQDSYTVATTAGTLRNTTTNDSGSPIIVNFDESFTLTTTAAQDGLVITVTATDRITPTLQGEATVTQQAPGPVVLTPPTASLPAGGGMVPLSVSGGTATSYTITTTAGTLQNTVTNQTGSSITVNFGEGFTLTTDASADGTTITVTATDTVTSDSATATVTQSVPGIGSIDLFVSSPQLDSDGSETVTLTALVRDANNNAVEGALVSFAATAGVVVVTNTTTDTNGRAIATLGTGGDQRNQVIIVTASTGELMGTNLVSVTGTTITFGGTSALVLGNSTVLSIFLRDASGNGIANEVITVTSERGNMLSPAPPLPTDSTGRTVVTVTADFGGRDTITASALEGTVSNTFTLDVSDDNFVFELPAEGTIVNLGDSQEVILHWDVAGTNQVGEAINFFATRGTLSTPPTAVTDSGGDARVTITSDNAGPAVITANTNIPGGPSAQVSIQFVAVTPDSLTLQASPTIIGVNAAGSADEQSIITAVVRDPNNNPVANQTVSFNLTDTSGGRISPASAITDAFGRATTVYTAGLTPSASNGVIINASVITPARTIRERVTLTVAQQSLFITLGTSQFIETPTSTQYAKPYTVLVTDAEGNAVPNQLVTLSVLPTRYEKGTYEPVFDLQGGFLGWQKQRSIVFIPATGLADDSDLACDNEDINRNGTLNIGEDVNNNRRLDPGVVATVDPSTVTTDASGFGFFNVVYAREFTWVEVALEARTIVAGSESSSRVVFFLPGLADDFNDPLVAPPGIVSPFGVAITCGCSELSTPMCPVSLPPVVISFDEDTLPASGGNVILNVSGGTQSSYTVTTTAGVLTDTDESGARIIVNFEESFTLTTGPDEEGMTIIITASDNLSGQEGTAAVVQEVFPPVTITPSSFTLGPAGGTTDSFTAQGGREIAYRVETTAGTLMNEITGESDATITINFMGSSSESEPFTLTTTTNADITVTDTVTGQQAMATVTVQAP